MPERIQRKRTKGWRMPPNTIYVGRPSPWGNPYYPGSGHRRGFFNERMEPCHYDVRDPRVQVAWFREFLAELREFQPENYERTIAPLRGKNLACWCKLPAAGEPDVCHAAVLLELANK